jgi:hypothetical protein
MLRAALRGSRLGGAAHCRRRRHAHARTHEPLGGDPPLHALRRFVDGLDAFLFDCDGVLNHGAGAAGARCAQAHILNSSAKLLNF